MIVVKCLVLAISVFIGVQAANQSVYSRKKVVNGIYTTETLTKNEQYWEYRKEHGEGSLAYYTEVQRLAADGRLDFYVFGNSHGTPFRRTVTSFKRLSQPADGSLGPFAEDLKPPPSGRGGSVEGGVSSTGCTRGRHGPDCQLLLASPALNDEEGPDDIGGRRRSRTRPTWRIQRVFED